MEILKYGEFEIIPDIQRTKEYYSDLTVGEDQIARNFCKYCETMPEEEKLFFENFGVDPTKISIHGLYNKKKKELFCYGLFYVSCDFLKTDLEPVFAPEKLTEDENTAEDENGYRFAIGNLSFIFEDPAYSVSADAPDGFVAANFIYMNLPWLLEEKPGKDIIYREPPKKWELHKHIWNAAKSKKAELDYIRESIKQIEATLTECGIEFRKMGKNEYERYRNEWVKRMMPSFADEKRVRAHCLGEGCYLWHLFSYEHVKAVEGDEALQTFDATKKCKSILLCNWENKGYVLLHTYKLKAQTLEKFADVIVTSANFAWTYCKTHEENCGPYFYRPIKK